MDETEYKNLKKTLHEKLTSAELSDLYLAMLEYEDRMREDLGAMVQASVPMEE